MSAWLVLATMALSAAVAALLSGQVAAFVPDQPRWVRARPHVLLAAAAGVGAAWLASGWAELIAFAAAGVGCALLMVIDLAVCRLPDRLVAATLFALAVPMVIAAVINADWDPWWRALLAGLALLAGYFLLAFLAPAGLGLGDVKFAAVVGFFSAGSAGSMSRWVRCSPSYSTPSLPSWCC